MRSEYEKYKIGLNKTENISDSELDVKIQELRKERIKLQTSNVERSRIDRAEARQEMYYEYVGNVVQSLTPPEFHPIEDNIHHEINYLVGLADVHYGAAYCSVNNEYSPEEAKRRFEYLTYRLIHFVQDKHITTLTIVSLGDLIQGVLRLSDLKINDSSIVKATVEICRLIASMLNKLSTYTKIAYYHTPSANHTQLRVLNAKASELADEDLEYLMGNYIKDLCVNNERVTVHLAKEGNDFIEVYIPGNEIIAMHGHQLKNIENAIKDISILHKKFYDTVLLGHYHSGKEIPSHEGILGDAEVLISPSFVGSDPYSDKLCKGSKACVKVYGFDKLFGHTETYKIILN
nr:MAG TPA: DNA polymerase II small subunit [Bacteriophage sp.]